MVLRKNRCQSVLPLILLCAFIIPAQVVSAAPFYGLTVSPLTGDTDILNNGNQNYLFAVNLTNVAINTDSFVANNVSFLGTPYHQGKIAGRSYSYTSMSSTPTSAASGTYTLPAGANSSRTMFDRFIYYGQALGNKSRLALDGLEEGKTYTLQIYGREWGTNQREHYFSFDTNADGVADALTLGTGYLEGKFNAANNSYAIDQNTPGNSWSGLSTGPFAVSYTFVANSQTLNTYLQSNNGGDGWHNYGFSLYEHTDVAQQKLATTPTIKNGSFEADRAITRDHGGNHGYIQEQCGGLISGWSANLHDRVGLAPALNVSGGTDCIDFSNGKTIPDGTQCVFVQSNGAATTISQDVYGFEPGKYYALTYAAAGRGTQTADLTLVTGDYHLRQRVSGNFQHHTRRFKASDYMQTISFTNHTGGDTTLLLDDISLLGLQVTEISMMKYFGDNFSVNANSNTISQSTNDKADRFSGPVGPVDYIKRAGSGNLQQVGHGPFPGALFMATYGAGNDNRNSSAFLDHNFNDSFDPETGAMYEINFKVNPYYCYDDGLPFPRTNRSWAGIVFGASRGDGQQWINNSDGMGLLLRPTGEYQIFVGNTAREAGTLSDSILAALPEDGWYDVSLRYWVDAWAGTPLLPAGTDVSVMVDFFINDQYLTSITAEDGFKDNYLSLLSYGSDYSGTAYTFFDDLSVWSSAGVMNAAATPEPTTWILLLMGATALGVVRKRR